MRDWLSVLLPLTQPPAVDTLLDWEGDLRAVTPDTEKGPLIDALVAAATRGKAAVEAVLANDITASVKAVLDDEGDGQ